MFHHIGEYIFLELFYNVWAYYQPSVKWECSCQSGAQHCMCVYDSAACTGVGKWLHMLLFNPTLWQPQGLTWGMVTWYQPVHFVSKVFNSVHISRISVLRTTSFGVSEHPSIKWTIRKKVEEIISFFLFWGWEGGGEWVIYIILYTKLYICSLIKQPVGWLWDWEPNKFKLHVVLDQCVVILYHLIK